MDSMQSRPPNANQEVSNTIHPGSVSDSLGRLAAASECMASLTKLNFSIGLHIYPAYFGMINSRSCSVYT